MHTMVCKSLQPSAVWAIAADQHGVVTRDQLLGFGYSRRAIDHRIAKGRLHPIWPSVFAVGRPELARHGLWMAAVLACGEGAALSHLDAGALYQIVDQPPLAGCAQAASAARARPIEVSVPYGRCPVLPGISVHRRTWLTAAEVTRRHRIPVTAPAPTLVDLAARLETDELEAAVNAADKRSVINPEALRGALDSIAKRPGMAVLRKLLDRRTFTLTDSRLERLFRPIARRASLSPPQTQQWINGFRVDFHWPELGLVVETDSLRYHRTATEQARDRLRDQTHTAAGLTALRFTHAQVRYEPEHVCTTLARTATRLRSRPARPGADDD